MNAVSKQHLIDPEVCIRCNTCEATCPIGAITHDDNNYVVDASICNFCMDCVSPCPTGSIDHWFVVKEPFSLEAQFSWLELPPKPAEVESSTDALEDEASALLDAAHAGAGGHVPAPASASKPRINLFNRANPAVAKVTGNLRITGTEAESDTRHIILDFGTVAFPVLEGQSIGMIPPGLDAAGQPHAMRLYSIASPRDGERPNTNNLSLTVKRVAGGVASNWLCDLKLGETLNVIGPFGATFLMPDDPDADILMICTGTGAAPFRAFTMRRQRNGADGSASMTLVFGARSSESLPYFGPLLKVPDRILKKRFAFSRVEGQPKTYVQDKLREERESIARWLSDPDAYIYVCGLRAMERGVEEAFTDIADALGMRWSAVRDAMRAEGRYHIETY